MAFQFNWSPLAADASFYIRAQELLTAALNKSPKPPIIVDDILVSELNLGSVPPELEILEIGDLAEDRFRGIFKMRYCGDAFLTLRTRVQANPLNTFLSTRPSFASPDPLAAASGLTIPLKITLSEIKLSAFIILVFSRQKGITLVFRNDPLESLKVSSTFDSIPFVRDYLQKEISSQLRTLLINEVPAIIHRLSLRLFVPEYREQEDEAVARTATETATGAQDEPVTDPLASPPSDPVDARGQALDPAQVASLSLDAASETQSLFSRKNLLRLAALRESNRTLSLFTPRLADVVYRAGPAAAERAERAEAATARPLPLRSLSLAARRTTGSHASTPSVSAFSATSDGSATQLARPPLSSTGSSFAPGRPSRPGRKRKHRIVDLRKKAGGDAGEDAVSVSGESSFSATQSSAATSDELPRSAPEQREVELVTPPTSPLVHTDDTSAGTRKGKGPQINQDATPRPSAQASQVLPPEPQNIVQPPPLQPGKPLPCPSRTAQHLHNSQSFGANRHALDSLDQPPLSGANASRLAFEETPATATSKESEPLPASSSSAPFLAAPFPYADSSPGGVLEQAWMMRMANEIARRVQEQKGATRADGDFWGSPRTRHDVAPPAYQE